MKAALALVPLLVSCTAFDPRPEPGDSDLTIDDSQPPYLHDGKGGGTAVDVRPAAAGIGYGGGPVLLGTPNVYFIWYGNWAGNSATTILPDFMSNLGGSPYFDINTTYSDSRGNHVTGAIRYAGSTNDNYSQGSAISDQALVNIVSRAISGGAFPSDTNAVYFVLTSQDVTLSGFCGGFCGYHTRTTIGGRDIKYSFVGNPAQCPRSCAPDSSPAPNGNLGADGMASILAHELEETVTDPDLNGWGDSAGENADKCAWTFGTTYRTASGALANMRLGTRDYLIQQNLDANTGRCELALPGGPPPPPPPPPGGGGPQVMVLGPAAGSTLHPGGPLDITAHVTDSAGISQVVVNWTSPSGTTQFTMSQNAAGNWELSTTLSSSARTGTTRSFTVTARDVNGQSATSPPVSVRVQ